MFRRFIKRFESVEKDGTKRVYPRGWAGELTAAVAKKADEARALMPERDEVADDHEAAAAEKAAAEKAAAEKAAAEKAAATKAAATKAAAS